MRVLVRMFYDITMRKRGPEDLPRSGFFFGLTLITFFVLNTVAYLSTSGLGQSIQMSAVEISLICFWMWVLLAVSGRLPRFNQTMSALFGAQSLIVVVATPIFYWRATTDVTSSGRLFAELCLIVSFGWIVLAIGHIMSRALDMHLIAGVFLSMVYSVTSFVVIRQLFVSAN